jgi:hypothetical protein
MDPIGPSIAIEFARGAVLEGVDMLWMEPPKEVLRQRVRERAAAASRPPDDEPRQRVHFESTADWPQASPIRMMARDAKAPRVAINDFDIATDEAWAVIEATNDPQNLEQFMFLFGGVPARLKLDGTGYVEVLDLNGFMFELNNRINWGRWKVDSTTKKKRWAQEATVPRMLAQIMLGSRSIPLPTVQRLVRHPTLTADGSITSVPGFYPDARLIYLPPSGLVMPKIPAKPTKGHVTKARKVIDNVLADFPFADSASRAHAFALMLQPFVRSLIEGPTPLFAVDAPAPGNGKGLLVETCLYPALGPIKANPFVPNNIEINKTILAKLVAQDGAMFYDNVQRGVTVDSSVLASALTSVEFEGRELGVTRMRNAANTMTWTVTGNNLAMSTEVGRRTALIRLNRGMANPGDFQEFAIEDLRGHVAEHRGELAWAALTLARAWWAAGAERWRPAPGVPRLGSYESWYGVLGGILHVAGVSGFLENIEHVREVVADQDDDIHEVWTAIAEKFGGEVFRANDLIRSPVPTILGIDPYGENASKKLAAVLRQNKDLPIGGYTLRYRGKPSGVARWQLEDTNPKAAPVRGSNVVKMRRRRKAS